LTIKDTDTHIPDVYDIVVGTVNAVVLNNRQFCYILDPVDESGKNQFGRKELKKGEATFFLKPFERLEKGIQDVIVLADDEALLLKAVENFVETVKSKSGDTERVYKAGEKWMIYGPCDFIPSVKIDIIERRKTIPLDENEGVYIRDTITGEIKAEIGKSYMLKPQEVLYSLELPPIVDELVNQQLYGVRNERDKSSVKAVSRDTLGLLLLEFLITRLFRFIIIRLVSIGLCLDLIGLCYCLMRTSLLLNCLEDCRRQKGELETFHCCLDLTL